VARVVFMGTPEFAIPSLEALCGQHDVVLVITQPDRRQGRGRELRPPPVKEVALKRGLPVWQPTTLRTPGAVETLSQVGADVYVTAAIGLFLPPDVLALPPHGCLNVHASLLPRWRGAAPVSAAILYGDEETGVTLMQTDEGLDTGPIVAQVRCPIRADDTAETLARRLARMGADLLIETLPRWLSGQIRPRPQPEEAVTYSLRLKRQDGHVDWHQSAAHIERMVRAYTPWPGTFTFYDGQRLKILRGHTLSDWQGAETPGEVLRQPDDGIAVATGEGALALDQVQLAGSRAMPVDALARGHRDFIGSILS
jgi:methionyl-tRNA formyltransferase